VQFKSATSSTLAVILAGGKGKRMDVLCHVRPKPSLPFAGRFKVIDFSLSNCVYSGIKNIAVLTDYQRFHMADYLRGWHQANANFASFHILEPNSGSYRGTADAVYQHLAYLGQHRAENVLILAGDHVYKLDYRRMLGFHRQMKADVTLGVIPVPAAEVHRFGAVFLDSDDRIVEFLEKSPTSRSSLASMGIYVFNTDVLVRRLVEDASDPLSCHDFGYSLLPKMARQDRVFAYRFDGYWRDIGTVDAYYDANMELIKEEPGFSLDGTSPVLTQEQGLPSLQIASGANVRNSLVDSGCTIRGYVENSILSSGVRVEEQAQVRNSVIMKNTSIGYHSVVDYAILDEGVNVGEFCYIGFGSSLIPGGWDVTVLGKGAAIPAHTAIGRNCKVLPGVGHLDFASTVVPAGAIVSKCPDKNGQLCAAVVKT
jgi:glucose-1-phosphate adenylyltransferase